MGAKLEISRSERTLALLGGARFISLFAPELDDPAKVRRVIREGLPVGSAQYAREHSGVPARLFDGEKLLLQVPSLVVPYSWNYLINAHHPAIS